MKKIKLDMPWNLKGDKLQTSRPKAQILDRILLAFPQLKESLAIYTNGRHNTNLFLALDDTLYVISLGMKVSYMNSAHVDEIVRCIGKLTNEGKGI